ncbi:hypothetical protein BDQ17DRAFT_1426382 [Cyathus striatus]|nr:hypothetical protein BDQ17DRAFT_1426382 [Cyathus striatus]
MPNLWRPLQKLSFLFTSSKRCPSTDLPDYYRTTRQEDYGPNLRHSSRSEYITNVLDIRRKESFEDSCSFLMPVVLDYKLDISRQTSDETLNSGGSQTRKNKKINEKCKTILSSAQVWCFLFETLDLSQRPMQTSIYSLKRNLSKRKVHLVTQANDDFELDLSN